MRPARRAILRTMIDTQPQATNGLSHLRAYLAGTGATGSLIAGTVVAFLSLAAFVAFHGMPFANSGGSFGSAYVGSGAVGAPEAAARSLAAAPRSVASTPVRGAPAGAAGLPGAAGGAPTSTATTSALGSDSGAVPTTPSTPQAPSGGGSGSGPVTGIVDPVDPTGGGISQTTNDATQQLGNTVNQTQGAVGQTLNDVRPGLGDTVNQTVDGATGGLLGGLSK